MFFGQYGHSLDEKFRVTLPAKYRGPLEHGLVITRGLDGCLWVYTADEWETVAAKIDSLPWTQRESRAFTRFMFSSAFDLNLDSQGRIRIPDLLLEHAGITSDVVIVGGRSKIEIWARERWLGEKARAEADPEGLAEKLHSLGII